MLQDLAFIDNKFYAGDKGKIIQYNNSFKKVLGVNGQIVNTTSSMFEFKRNIERLIEDNPKVIFINCSRGAKIKGTREMKIKDLI